MAAVELEWIPETLYNTAISAVVDNYIRSRRDIRSLPENIQFDVYYKVRPTGSLGPRRRRRPWAAPPSTSAARPAALEAGSPPRPAAVAASRYPATPASASRAVRPPPGGFLCERCPPSPLRPRCRPAGNAWPSPVPPGPPVAGVFSSLSSLVSASAGLFFFLSFLCSSPSSGRHLFPRFPLQYCFLFLIFPPSAGRSSVLFPFFSQTDGIYLGDYWKWSVALICILLKAFCVVSGFVLVFSAYAWC